MASEKDLAPTYKFYIAQRVFDFLSLLPPTVVYIFLIIYGSDAIKAFAGTNTKANIHVVVHYFISKKSSFGVPWILATISFIWAKTERKLRKKKISAVSGYIKELEGRLHSERTSSGLTAEGDTNPADRSL